ncbi:MAG: metallophosphoesterase family protein [Planctomycetales bacterium]
MARLIAIGDIHGHSTALASLLEVIDPGLDDTLVPLGDYVDRGPDSRGVIDQLIALGKRCRLVPLLGNHDEHLLRTRAERTDPGSNWDVPVGSTATLDRAVELFLPRHLQFIEGCRTFFETERHFFVHANYIPELPLHEHDGFTLRWLSLRQHRPQVPHYTGKTAVVGHTRQLDGEILDLGYLKCIDTGCYKGGWLTGLDVLSGRLWQVNSQGEVRQSAASRVGA